MVSGLILFLATTGCGVGRCGGGCVGCGVGIVVNFKCSCTATNSWAIRFSTTKRLSIRHDDRKKVWLAGRRVKTIEARIQGRFGLAGVVDVIAARILLTRR